MIKEILKYFECDKYKKLYEIEKEKYEELEFYVQQLNNQQEEIVDLLKKKRELRSLKNKVAGVKFEK
tara:strand:+ start:165 stop:365 length:201 start_codon:yes stop_codon:yes gene_type:complete